MPFANAQDKPFLKKTKSRWDVRNENIENEVGSGKNLTSHLNNPHSHIQLLTSLPRMNPAFSLIEILLALFFVATLITILLTSATTLMTGRRSNLQAIATKIATRDIETLRQADFSSLPADTGSTCLQDYATELAKLPNPCHMRQVVNFQNDPDIKQFTITLTWHDSGQDQCELSICKVQMNALIYKNGL